MALIAYILAAMAVACAGLLAFAAVFDPFADNPGTTFYDPAATSRLASAALSMRRFVLPLSSVISLLALAMLLVLAARTPRR